MTAVRQILDAIHALPRGEQKLILRELVQELGMSDSAPPVAANDQSPANPGLLEERGGILVFTGPVDLAALDHRTAREERIDHLIASLSSSPAPER